MGLGESGGHGGTGDMDGQGSLTPPTRQFSSVYPLHPLPLYQSNALCKQISAVTTVSRQTAADVVDEIWVRDTVNTNFMEGVLLV